MKRKTVSQVVAVIGVIALCVSVAQAGGGQAGGTLPNFLECRSVTGGANAGDAVSILDLGGNVLEQNAIVGMTVLACRQVFVTVKPGGGLLAVPQGDHLTCYNLATQGKPATTNLDYNDAFFTGLNLTSIGARYLCSPAGIGFPQ